MAMDASKEAQKPTLRGGGTVLTYTKIFLQTFQANLQNTITYFKRFTNQVDPVTLSHTKRLKSEKIYISKKKHRKGNKLPNAIFLFFFSFLIFLQVFF